MLERPRVVQSPARRRSAIEADGAPVETPAVVEVEVRKEMAGVDATGYTVSSWLAILAGSLGTTLRAAWRWIKSLFL